MRVPGAHIEQWLLRSISNEKKNDSVRRLDNMADIL